MFFGQFFERQNDLPDASRLHHTACQEHMEENLAIFDFELTDDEVKKLSDISQSMTGSSALQRNQHTHFFCGSWVYIPKPPCCSMATCGKNT